MANLLTVPTILEHAHRNKIAVELRSAPGVGKTSITTQFGKIMAEKTGKPFAVCVRHAIVEDPIESGGVLHICDHPTIEGESIAKRTRPSFFPQDYEFPEGIPDQGIIVLDESGQCDDDQRKAQAKLVDEGRLGNHDLADFGHWSIVLTSNRTVDKSGVGKPLAFETNRKMIIDIEYNVDSHCQWMNDNGISHKLSSFARSHAAVVCSPTVPDHDDPFCTPRSYVRASLMLQSMGVVDMTNLGESPSMIAKLAGEAVMGLIGEGAAARLMGYLRHLEHMVDIEDILKTPESAPVPERPDVMWAVVQMMASFAKEQGQAGGNRNLLPMFTYMERMPREFQMTTVRMIAKSNKRLLLDSRYQAWVSTNRELILAALAADKTARGG